MGAGIHALVRWMFHFPEGQSVFSVKGFLVSFLVMLLLAGAIRAILWLDRRVGKRFRGAHGRSADVDSGVASYRRLVELLAGQGLERPPAETPREFARRARDFL